MDEMTKVFKGKSGYTASNWLGQDLIWTQVCLIPEKNKKDSVLWKCIKMPTMC